ncbi:coiled-coil protein [Trema orientale]|uniref:Coiled-coil protein n=1 Tax=Trema orientale TaxID=63057 RepID=A0A2P5C6V8_TREOI|nr:coiled-coil protein [Trema orientale]
MGGKGRKRREKNYRAAHGGYSRLPPPPNPSQLDALPSKLRQLISLTSPKSQGSAKDSKNVQQKRKNGDGASDLKSRRKDEVISETAEIKDKNLITPQPTNDHDDSVRSSTNEKRKKKRKRKAVDDLRFEAASLEKSDISSKRRERKKKYLEARKHKHKKAKTENTIDFPGREKIEFGDIVQAPLKLSSIPKPLKNTQDASHERLRLQAIESYRKSKGWTSRPGIHLPLPVTAPTEGL